MKVLVINGPNLNMLGIREKHIYGTETYADLKNLIHDYCQKEGIDVDIAQRIIDFCCGACYCMSGSLQKVSSYIFILTPSSVEISGDIQDILSGAFDLPNIRTDY